MAVRQERDFDQTDLSGPFWKSGGDWFTLESLTQRCHRGTAGVPPVTVANRLKDNEIYREVTGTAKRAIARLISSCKSLNILVDGIGLEPTTPAV